MSTPNNASFSIFDHQENLEPAREKGRYICPACGGNNLTFNSKTGAYQCWSGCEKEDVREAISPWASVSRNQSTRHRPHSQRPSAPTPALIPSGKIELAKLPMSVAIPQKQHRPDSQRGEAWEIEYSYSDTQWVWRTEWIDATKPKGRDKQTLPYFATKEGEIKCGKGDQPWQPYRIEEAAQHGIGKWITFVEGESCVEYYRSLQLVSITLQGGSWDGDSLQNAVSKLKQSGVAGIVYFPDHDKAGTNKAAKVVIAAATVGLPCLVVDPLAIWEDMPNAGDIVDWVDWGRSQGMDQKDFIAKLEAEIHAAVAARIDEQKLKDPDERLKLELGSLLQESDPIRKARRKAEICSFYRLGSAVVDDLLKYLDQQTRTVQSRSMGLDELFDLPQTGIDYLIPGMLPVGETVLLVADPKTGKSLLAYDAAYSVATGEDTFLGEVCRSGKVLIIQTDESVGTAKGRLLKRGFRREDAANVRFMDSFNISQLLQLEEQLEDFKPSLVVIDSLRRINAGREISENSAEFADNIYKLKEIVTRYNASAILIHHSNKNPDAVGVGRVRGSSAIAGAVWGVWQLDHIPKPDPNNKKRLIIDPKDPARIFSVSARDVEGQRLKVELDPENNHWINHGEEGASEGEAQERKTQERRILELLHPIAPTGMEAQEINQQLGIGKGIYSVLNRLLGKRLIGSRPSAIDRRRTVYFCPKGGFEKEGDSPPPPPCDPIVIEYPETVATYSVESSITNLSQVDHNRSQGSEFDLIESIFKVDSASVLEVDHNLATQGGGGGVIAPQPTDYTAEFLPPTPLTPSVLSPSELILQCQTWSALVEAMEKIATVSNKPKADVFSLAVKHLSVEDRQHLVQLLAAHIQQSPRDQWAYSWLPKSSRQLVEKAKALAKKLQAELVLPDPWCNCPLTD